MRLIFGALLLVMLEHRERFVGAARSCIGELADGWDPERHSEVRRLLSELAHAFASEPPVEPVHGGQR